MAKAFNIPQKGVALVQRVAKDSPADKVGIKGGSLPITYDERTFFVGGDMVLSVEDIMIEDVESLRAIRKAINLKKAGEELSFKILREGNTRVLTTKLKK